MLAIYLQPDAIKVVQGKLRKDNSLDIQDYFHLQESEDVLSGKEYLDILTNSSEETCNEDLRRFSELFKIVKSTSK